MTGVEDPRTARTEESPTAWGWKQKGRPGTLSPNSIRNMAQRLTWSLLDRRIRTAAFWIQAAISLGIGTASAVALEALTSAHLLWQISAALSVFLLVLGSTRLGWERVQDRRRRGYPDEQLADALDNVAQRMVRAIADGMRTAPDPPVTANFTGGDDSQYKAWQQSVAQRERHDNAVMARLVEDAQVELGGLISELRQRDVISADDARALWWNFESMHSVRRIPSTLGEWANQLRR